MDSEMTPSAVSATRLAVNVLMMVGDSWLDLPGPCHLHSEGNLARVLWQQQLERRRRQLWTVFQSERSAQNLGCPGSSL